MAAERAAFRDERTFSKLDAVTVPPGVGPGEPFEVWITKKHGGLTKRTLYRAAGNVPAWHARQVSAVSGPRYSQRPSKLSTADPEHASRTSPALQMEWDSGVEMPFECHAEDVGWLPGPAGGSSGRPRPDFLGRRMGPRDRAWARQASAREIMKRLQFSDVYLDLMLRQARQHAHAWSQTHSRPDGIERSWHASELRREHCELWFAARVRIATLSQSVPIAWLYDRSSTFYIPELDAKLPQDVFKWLNRHLSFGTYGINDADDDGAADDLAADDGQQQYDRYRKRRELSDVARQLPAKAFNPGQDVCFDDFVRLTRHLDGIRIRHKAAVHTGRPCDGLNDVGSNYFLYWEEQGWEAQRSDGGNRPGGNGAEEASADDGADSEDGSDVEDGGGAGVYKAAAGKTLPRIRRAVTHALEPHANYCVWADQGVGEWISAKWLRANGYGTGFAMQKNRIGLPRRLIRQFCQGSQVGWCSKDCDHAPDSQSCKRWRWTVLHKGEWELQILADGKNSLVILLTDCTSATRTMAIGRTVNKKQVSVQAPEGIAIYSNRARSGTDGGDQHRKALGLATRRQLRQGPKGALFDAEVAFVNGAILARYGRGHEVTTMAFAMDFYREVVDAVSMRRRPLRAALAHDLAVPMGPRTRGQSQSHVPEFPVLENREKRARGDCEDVPARWAGRGASCCLHDHRPAWNECVVTSPKRAQVICHDCAKKPGCSGWYHFKCFFECHHVAPKE